MGQVISQSPSAWGTQAKLSERLHPQTAYEGTAGVTPAAKRYDETNSLRFGPDGDALTDNERNAVAAAISDSKLIVGRRKTARAYSQFAFDENRVWNFVTDFGAVGDFATVNDDAIDLMINSVADGDTVEIPIGIFNYEDFSLIGAMTKRINFIGQSKFRSVFYAVNPGVDVTTFGFAGTTGARIQDINLKRLRFASSNSQARALDLTWVNKSNIEDLYFYNVYRGIVGDNMWGNNFRNISVFGVEKETYFLVDECNVCHFDHCEARSVSADAVKITGTHGGLTFTALDIEAVDDATKAGILIAPQAGELVMGTRIQGYWEKIKGVAIRCDGADADSVRGLHVAGSYFFGGHAAYFASTAGQAQYGIDLANVRGFSFKANTFHDWQSAAFFRDGTEHDGEVHCNSQLDCPALSNSANAFSPDVDVRNNFAGRRVESRSVMPAAGSYTQGDLIENTAPAIDGNNMILRGWIRLTTGSGHVLGTDWGRLYASHTTPAT